MEGICIYCEEHTNHIIFIQERTSGWRDTHFTGFEMACYDCLCRRNGQWKHAVDEGDLLDLEWIYAEVSVLVEKDEKNRCAKFTIRENERKDHIYQIIEKKDELVDGFLVDCLKDGLSDTINFLCAYIEKVKTERRWFNSEMYRGNRIILTKTHIEKIANRDYPLPSRPSF